MNTSTLTDPRQLLDAQRLRATMGLFATGVTVVSWWAEGQPAGMTANAFMSVSLDPPLVLVSVRASSRFHQWVGVGARYGINLLTEDQQDLSDHFGGRPRAGFTPPFHEVEGTPLLEGSLAQLLVKTVDVHPAGDHLLHIGALESIPYSHGERQGEVPRQPLVFHRGKYQRLHIAAPPVTAGGEQGGRA